MPIAIYSTNYELVDDIYLSLDNKFFIRNSIDQDKVVIKFTLYYNQIVYGTYYLKRVMTIKELITIINSTDLSKFSTDYGVDDVNEIFIHITNHLNTMSHEFSPEIKKKYDDYFKKVII